ncbi:MAG: FixH family protein [Gammaproteobacteria bacterium]|nr:FixH family protein [Gammaproteobacteria bacterium]NND36277.1 nitrogen fixation protein FixH [Gammaproteobacteria bacterium]
MTKYEERPWYRQFWPWFIAFPPAATVVAGFITLWLAGMGPSLVVDDYGQIGKVTTQRAVRDERASELALHADVHLAAISDENSGIVLVELSLSGTGFKSPDRISLRIVHPTLGDRDVETVLSGQDGRYVGNIPRPIGRLYIHVGDIERTWRLVGELGARSTDLKIAAAEAAGA